MAEPLPTLCLNDNVSFPSVDLAWKGHFALERRLASAGAMLRTAPCDIIVDKHYASSPQKRYLSRSACEGMHPSSIMRTKALRKMTKLPISGSISVSCAV